MKRFCNTSDFKILGTVFSAFAVLFFLLVPLFHIISYKSGMECIVLNNKELKRQGIIRLSDDNDLYYTTDSDPNFTICLGDGITVERLSFDIDFPINPGPVVVYYKNAGDENFSELKRVVCSDYKDGEHVVEIKQKNVTEIRIDPTVYAGMKMRVNSVILNPPKNVAEYFKTDFRHIVYYALTSGFTASLILLAKQILNKLIYENKQKTI